MNARQAKKRDVRTAIGIHSDSSLFPTYKAYRQILRELNVDIKAKPRWRKRGNISA